MGFLSPAHRGSLASTLVVLFFLSGVHAGYIAARLYKFLGGKAWKRNTVLTALTFPGVVVSVFMCVNMAAWAEGSTNAIPFKYMLLFLVLWFGLSVPLVFAGAYYGYKAADIKPPVPARQIARAIPPQPWYLRSAVVIPAAGLLPFMAVLIELFFIMESIWLNEVYYMFSVLALVCIILLITAAEVSVVVTYFTLCAENWNWWWRAFLAPGASGAYVALYSVYYGYAALSLDGALAPVMYVGYMFTAAWAFFLFTGAVGFLTALYFNMRIFAAIKVD
jgi:transmembrane 9 superfamily protein 2/4